MTQFWQKRYSPLPHKDDLSLEKKLQLSDIEQDQDQNQNDTTHLIFTPIWQQASGIVMYFLFITLVNILIFGISVAILIHSRSSNTDRRSPDSRYHNPSINQDIKKVSSYYLHLTTLNGHIHSNTSIFRHDPSPLVDAAWSRISTESHQLITVPHSAVTLSHKNASLAVGAPPSWNSGPNTYVAQIDVFHQIHCLNELRKEIHWDYYYASKYPGGRDTVPEAFKLHRKHCLHMILQNIMCHADVDVISHNWIRSGQEGTDRPEVEPFADFSLVKQCRDFDGLLEWTERHAVEDPEKRWRELRWEEGMPIFEGDSYL